MSASTRIQLMPGVWLTAIQTRKFKSSYWSALLLTPLRQETAAMTALLPRVLCRGTANYPDQEQLGVALDELYGGVVCPVVTKLGEIHAAGFQAVFLDDALVPDGLPVYRRAAELLGDLLTRPATRNGRLRADYVDSECQNLLSEQEAQRNDKRRYAALRLTQEMCANERYGIDRLGDSKSARSIRVAKLDRYDRTLLQESRIELYYCGSVPAEQIRQAWVESLMGLPRKGEFDLPETEVIRHPEQVREVVEAMDVTQAKLSIGLRTQTPQDSEGYPALLVANAMLGGSPNSRLFQEVRERRSLCYYVSSVLDCQKGLISVHSGVAIDQAEEAKAAIFAQLESLQQGAFEMRELESARSYTVNQITAVSDSQQALYEFYRDRSLSEFPISPEELAAMVGDVTREDVIRAFCQMEPDTVYLLTTAHGEEAQDGTT